MNAIEQAVERAGGQKLLGDAIGASKSFVNQLVKGVRPIPPEYCPRIEAHTRVSCEELRPDLEWVRDAAGLVTHYQVKVGQAA